MIVRDDLPETPEWRCEPHADVIDLLPRMRQREPSIPANIELGGRGD